MDDDDDSDQTMANRAVAMLLGQKNTSPHSYSDLGAAVRPNNSVTRLLGHILASRSALAQLDYHRLQLPVISGNTSPDSPAMDADELVIGQQPTDASIIHTAHSVRTDLSDGESSTWSLLMSALFYELDTFNINWPNFLLALILIMLMLTTAIGNLFVIVAILIEKNLRTIGNYLVLSLAIADLLVACLVMPLAGIYQILDRWTLGVLLCDIWTSADVFCCTASILHLLAIALDRYWAVTRVDYIRCQRNERRILFMIFFVWITACVISLAPVFGWKDAQFEWRITNDKECLISQDVGYQIFATCTTFYFPLTLTLIFYWRIYQVARKRIRKKLDSRIKINLQHPSSSSSLSTPSSKHLPNSNYNNNINNSNKEAKCQSIATRLSKLKFLRKKAVKQTKITTESDRCSCSCHKTIGTIKKVDLILNPEGTKCRGSTMVRQNNAEQSGKVLSSVHLGRKDTDNRPGQEEVQTDIADKYEIDEHTKEVDIIGVRLIRQDENRKTCSKSLDVLGVTRSGATNQGSRSETGNSNFDSFDKCDINPDTNIDSSKCTTKQFEHQIYNQQQMTQTSSELTSHDHRANNLDCARCRRINCLHRHEDNDASVGWCSQVKVLDDKKDIICDWAEGGDVYAPKYPNNSATNADCSAQHQTLNDLSLASSGPRSDSSSSSQLSLSGLNGNIQNPPAPISNKSVNRSNANTTSTRQSSLCDCCTCCCETSTTIISQETTQITGCKDTIHSVDWNQQDDVILQDYSSRQQSADKDDTQLTATKTRQTDDDVDPERENDQILELSGEGTRSLAAIDSSKNKWKEMELKLEESGQILSTLIDADHINTNIHHQEQKGAGLCHLIDWLNCRPLAAQWRRLVAGLQRDSHGMQKVTRLPVLGISDGGAAQVARLEGRSILVDERGKSRLTANGPNHSSNLLEPCQWCGCSRNNEHVLESSRRLKGRQKNLTLTHNAISFDQADMRATTTKQANMVIAVSTANIAVTTTVAQTTATGEQRNAVRNAGSTPNHGLVPSLNSQSMSMEGVESKRERKAAKTLSIITGVFVICWLPFFVMAITMPLLELKPHKYVFAFLLWLGYVNSMLNPIIYTIFSPDFRKAFKRLLCGTEREKEAKKRRRRAQLSTDSGWT